VDEAVEEHQEVKRLLTELLTLDPTSEVFEVRLDELRDELERHVEEEEGEMFPIVQQELSTARLEALGQQMHEQFVALVGLQRHFAVADSDPASAETPDASALASIDVQNGRAVPVDAELPGR